MRVIVAGAGVTGYQIIKMLVSNSQNIKKATDYLTRRG